MGIGTAVLGGAAGGAVVSVVINAIDKVSPAIAGINKSLLMVGAGLTVAGIAGAGMISKIVSEGAKLEQTEAAFTTLLGSGEAATEMLKELADFASKTPFTIPGIEQGAKQLLAVGFNAEEVIPTLQFMGDIAAGVGLDQAGMNSLIKNLGQVKTLGKATTRELNDFAMRGIPIYDLLAEHMGKTKAEIQDMVSKGEVGFNDVEGALKGATSEGGRFFNAMDAQSKTFLGQVSNIQDSFIIMARIMSETFLPAAKWVAEKLAIIVGWMEKHPTLLKWGTALLGIATVLALVVGPLLIIVALLPVLIPLIVSGTAMIWGAVTATAAFTAVNIWWIAAVVGVIAIIVALIAAGMLLMKHWDNVKVVLHNLGVEFANVFKGIANVVLKVWNFVVNVVEDRINRIIKVINSLIKGINKISGTLGIPSISLFKEVDFSKFKAEMFKLGEYDTFKQSEPTTIVNIENVNGMTGKDLANSLQEELSNRTNLGV